MNSVLDEIDDELEKFVPGHKHELSQRAKDVIDLTIVDAAGNPLLHMDSVLGVFFFARVSKELAEASLPTDVLAFTWRGDSTPPVRSET